MIFSWGNHGLSLPSGKRLHKTMENHRKMVVLWEKHRKTIGKLWFYPLVNVYITMQNHNFHRTIHYFYGHFQ